MEAAPMTRGCFYLSAFLLPKRKAPKENFRPGSRAGKVSLRSLKFLFRPLRRTP